MNILISKFREMLFAVIPVTLIMAILNLTVVRLDNHVFLRFIVGAVFVVVGLSLFLFGVDLGIEPIGVNIGKEIVKSRKTAIFVISGFILGFIITIAEPDILIFAENVSNATNGAFGRMSLIVCISLGIGIMLSIGLIRILYDISIIKLFYIFYGIVLIVALVAQNDILGIAFDSAGATTGSMTVPFMLALGAGISSMKTRSNDVENDSFGLTGLASIGPIISVLLMSIFSRSNSAKNMVSSEIAETYSNKIFSVFWEHIPSSAYEVLMSLLPVILIFILLQITKIKLKKRIFKRIMKGVLYTFLGLVIFLTGVNAGFSEAGEMMGKKLVTNGDSWLIIVIGFVLGLCIIFAEPAVHVLGDQIEEVTGSSIKKPIVLGTMAIGVAVAITLAMLKILVPGIQLWHYLLLGYSIALILMRFIPKIFVGIAFDSGGVASGPMSVTFVLAFAQGVANSTGDGMSGLDGFGTIAIIALAPIITMEILGLIYKIKLKRQK